MTKVGAKVDDLELALFVQEVRNDIKQMKDKIEEIHKAQLENEKHVSGLVELKNKGTGILVAITITAALLILGVKSWIIDIAHGLKEV